MQKKVINKSNKVISKFIPTLGISNSEGALVGQVLRTLQLITVDMSSGSRFNNCSFLFKSSICIWEKFI